MVDLSYIEDQLTRIGFGGTRWNKPEIKELQNILIRDEKILECVNGYYEGGVALLVATDIRVLLVDKKPMGFLNVEDLRFDLINEIDYSHQMFSAQVTITGLKKLVFKSYNQPRLRKLVSLIQSRMSEIKKEQNDHADMQKQHLEDINKQLQTYLYAQQRRLEDQLSELNQPDAKPNNFLRDYLTSREVDEDSGKRQLAGDRLTSVANRYESPDTHAGTNDPMMAELVQDGRAEIYKQIQKPAAGDNINIDQTNNDASMLKIAYSKLPYVLSRRRRSINGSYAYRTLS